jgi:hypothetical protein
MKYNPYKMRVKSDINKTEPATLCVCRGSVKEMQLIYNEYEASKGDLKLYRTDLI